MATRSVARLPSGAGMGELPELTGWMTTLGTQLKLTIDSGGSGGVSLSDYTKTDAGVAPLASPRSVYVCLREGIDPDTLKFKDESYFKSPGVPADLVKMSFEHHESIRQDRLRSLVAQRDKVASDKLHVPAFVPGGGKSRSHMEMVDPLGSGKSIADLASEKSVIEAQRAAARTEKQREKMEESSAELQRIQFAAGEKSQKNNMKQAERTNAIQAAAAERARAAYEKAQQQVEEVRLLELSQRTEAAERFRVQETERAEELRLANVAKKAREEADRVKREKEEAWRKQTEDIARAAEEETRKKYEAVEAENARRAEALAAKKAEAFTHIAEKKEKFESRRITAQGKFDEQMKVRMSEFERSKTAADEKVVKRAVKEKEEALKRTAKGVENDIKREKCSQESEAAFVARQEKLMLEQEQLEAQVVAFADKTEKELTHKVMSKQLKALERVELANARERQQAFKRETVKAELKEKMERAEELKTQRARLAEERRMNNVRHAQQASALREALLVQTLKAQRNLFVDTHRRVNEMARTLASAGSGGTTSLPKIARPVTAD